MMYLAGGCGSTGGSGLVAVVPLDSGGHGEHFGAKIVKIRVKLSEICAISSLFFFLVFLQFFSISILAVNPPILAVAL
jgi:hypothetical protein